MNETEFNAELSAYTDEYIRNWLRLVDEFADQAELGPNHKLTCLLFSHLGIEKKLSTEVWRTGNKYVKDVVKLGEELKTDAD